LLCPLMAAVYVQMSARDRPDRCLGAVWLLASWHRGGSFPFPPQHSAQTLKRIFRFCLLTTFCIYSGHTTHFKARSTCRHNCHHIRHPSARFSHTPRIPARATSPVLTSCSEHVPAHRHPPQVRPVDSNLPGVRQSVLVVGLVRHRESPPPAPPCALPPVPLGTCAWPRQHSPEHTHSAPNPRGAHPSRSPRTHLARGPAHSSPRCPRVLWVRGLSRHTQVRLCLPLFAAPYPRSRPRRSKSF
jgi:hypothetical protein